MSLADQCQDLTTEYLIRKVAIFALAFAMFAWPFKGNSETLIPGPSEVIDEDKVNIQVNNYAGEKAEVKQDRNPYGGRDITVIIGEALGKDVSQGGPLHQSMRRTFGLSPVTAGR